MSNELDPLLNELKAIKELLHERSTVDKQLFVHGKLLVSDAFRPSRDAGIKLGSIGTTSTVLTNKLSPGFYHFTSDTDMFVEIGPTPTAQIDASYLMLAGAVYGPILIKEGDLVAAILSVGSNANLWMKPIQ